MRRALPAIWAALAACGDNRMDSSEAPVDSGPFQSAPHAPMPMVFPHTGTVLSDLQLVTLTYSDHDASAALAAFGDALVASDWYRTIASEYGMAGAQHVQQVSLGPAPERTEPALIEAQILALLTERPEVVHPTAVNNQVLYLLYVPRSVARSAALDGVSGYHEMLAWNGMQFPVAVVFEDDAGLPSLTVQASHQVINAVTNPYTPPKDGYYADPPKTDPWCLLRAEIADLCQGEEPLIEHGYAFARVYSSGAANENRPPCIPAIPGDSWSDVTAEPSQIQTVAPGGAIHFKLTGWSTQPLPDWEIQVQVADSSALTEDELRPQLSSETINNAVTATLTLHAPREAISGTIGAVTVLSGTNRRPWVVGIVVR